MPSAPIRFSIVLPTFRRPHTVTRAVGSVLKQTYPHWQLVVAQNDGEPPVALPRDPRIAWFRCSEKASASYARNCALAHASGDLLAYLDDDDLYVPSALEIFEYLFRSEPRAKMVACGIVLANGEPHHGFSTQNCCVRREYATPTWDAADYLQDQRYWRSLLEVNGWTEAAGTFVRVPRFVAVALNEQSGGLREGGL